MSTKTTNTNSDQEKAFDFLMKELENNNRKKIYNEAFGGKSKQVPTKSKFNYKYLAIAASLILISGVYIFSSSLFANDEILVDRIIDQTKIVYSFDMESRGTGLERSDNEKGQALMSKKSYSSAVKFYNQQEKKGLLENTDHFYFAAALLKTKGQDLEKAISFFDQIESTNSYYVEATWLKSLALIKLGKKDQAKELLVKLKRTTNYQKENIETLLNELLK